MQVCEVYLCNATRDFDQSYSYLPPAAESELANLQPGAVVLLPFGHSNSLREAWLYRIYDLEDGPDYKLKRIVKVQSKSLLNPDQFALAKEIRRRYFCSMSQALALMAPRSMLKSGKKTMRYTRLTDEEEAVMLLEEGSLRSINQVRVLEFLLDVGEASLQEIMAACQVSRSVLDTLRKKGLIENFSRRVKVKVEDPPQLEDPQEHTLNAEQRQALTAILEEDSPEYLLYGVTGSGKTEVYLRAAEQIIAAGRDVIILVPEISLTPLICNRIQARFGKSAAILHSRLTPAERYEQWRSIASGEKHLVAGARSAIFAPLKDIGLIVIDEEQESSYKSERTPRYETAEIARIRARQHQAKVLLASATPSLSTYYRNKEHKSRLLCLSQRAGGARLPACKIIDMRQSYRGPYPKIISYELISALEQSFAAGEQAMILLNRRGRSSFVMCQDCGHILKCDNCDVSLKEHHNPHNYQHNFLLCHYCGEITDLPSACPSCGSDKLVPYGIGTQQAEEILQTIFPQQRFLRMDFDTTAARQGHAKILEQFAAGEASCLIGTQMIAKGHDFAKVTTVGVLAADMLLGQGDYLAEERAFQLICQAAGRAGRRELAGRVLIQSFNPDNHAIVAGARQDYQGFYETEIQRRKVLGYPPFYNLGLITTSSLNQGKAERLAQQIQVELAYLSQHNNLGQELIIYPYQIAPIARLRRRWRYRIILKSPQRSLLIRVLSYISDLKLDLGASVNCELNPLRML